MKKRSPLSEAISVGILHSDTSALDLICQHLRLSGYEVLGLTHKENRWFPVHLKPVDVFIIFCKEDVEHVIDFAMKAKRTTPKAAILVIAEMATKEDLKLFKKYGVDSTLTHEISWQQLTTEVQNLASLKIFEDLVLS